MRWASPPKRGGLLPKVDVAESHARQERKLWFDGGDMFEKIRMPRRPSCRGRRRYFSLERYFERFAVIALP